MLGQSIPVLLSAGPVVAGSGEETFVFWFTQNSKKVCALGQSIPTFPTCCTGCIHLFFLLHKTLLCAKIWLLDQSIQCSSLLRRLHQARWGGDIRFSQTAKKMWALEQSIPTFSLWYTVSSFVFCFRQKTQRYGRWGNSFQFSFMLRRSYQDQRAED